MPDLKSERLPLAVLLCLTIASACAATDKNGNGEMLYSQGVWQYDHGDKRVALREFGRAFEIRHDADSAWRAGKAASALRDAHTAIDWFTKAIAIDPRHRFAFNDRGTCFRDLGMPELALADFKKAIAIEPTEWMFLNLGGIYAERGNLPLAFKYWREAEKLNPKNPWVYHDRALALESTGDYDKAFADMSKAVALAPREATILSKHAHISLRLGKEQSAVSDLSRCIAAEPKQPAFYMARADVYGTTKQYDRALKDYTTVLTLFPNDEEALRRRGETYLAMKQYEKSIADLTASIKSAPDDTARVYAGRARAYDALGKHDLAVADRKKAAALSAKRVEGY